MKMRKTKLLLALVCPAICLTQIRAYASASDGENYVTISIDASDDNGNLKYAIDSDDPAAFTDSNEFRIPEGTSHTIYVKDVAGNITSQTYTPAGSSPEYTYPETGIPAQTAASSSGGGDSKINIEVEIGDRQENANRENDYSNYEYLTDDPVEAGGATVAEKVKTDGSDTSEKVFYTFQTKEGETLYLVIDQGRSDDNVYLLDTVSINDLMVLADGAAPQQTEKEDNLLAALSKNTDEESGEDGIAQKDSGTSNSNLFIVLFIVAIGGGIYYYFKIYKPKKDEAMDEIDDAMDIDEFEAESEDEEIEFDIDDAEKEAFLESLINEDESESEEALYDADPDEYALSHMEMESGFPEEVFAPDLDFPEEVDFDEENFMPKDSFMADKENKEV